MTFSRQKTASNTVAIFFLAVLAFVFLLPIVLVLMNSFKSRLYISSAPFAIPDGTTFVGLENYIKGLRSSGFFVSSDFFSAGFSFSFFDFCLLPSSSS